MPRTKIVCTLGPATESPAVIRALIRAGMTVARLNYSHGTPVEKQQTAAQVRQVAAEEGRHVALMGDLQGPKIRIGALPDGGVLLEEGTTITLTSGPIANPQIDIPFPHPDIIPDIDVGDHILLDDGALELEAIAIGPQSFACRVCVGGVLTSRKGVNFPGVKLQIPSFTEKDHRDALQALELKLDFLALSFVRQASDVTDLRAYLLEHAGVSDERRVGEDPNHIPAIVAKIEKPEALNDLEAIVEAADAVMVARGDLGVETAPQQVPLVQKQIIQLCNRLGKPVITATQMLQSMIENPRPTRAEASDVANAILDGSDAVMLSGETSVGEYPVEATQMMATIAETVEGSSSFPYNQLLDMEKRAIGASNFVVISEAVSRAAIVVSEAAHANAIVTATESGRTARLVARHRPHIPLLGMTPFTATARRMQLIWGVTPTVVTPFNDTDGMIETMVRSVVACDESAIGQNIVLMAGVPFTEHGVTNMIQVHTINAEDIDPVLCARL